MTVAKFSCFSDGSDQSSWKNSALNWKILTKISNNSEIVVGSCEQLLKNDFNYGAHLRVLAMLGM